MGKSGAEYVNKTFTIISDLWHFYIGVTFIIVTVNSYKMETLCFKKIYVDWVLYLQ